jgi:hypothetical protein
MKLQSLKYLILITIFLSQGEINKNHFYYVKNDLNKITNSRPVINESQKKDCLNLELRKSKSRPTNQDEKVETTVIDCSGSNNSESRFINLLIIQKIVFSERDYSLSSPYYLLISQTFHISTFIRILRI